MKSSDSTRRIKSREIVKRKIEEIERRMSRSARKETATTERWRSKRGKSEPARRKKRRTRSMPDIILAIKVKTLTTMDTITLRMISWASDATRRATVQRLTLTSLSIRTITVITTLMRSRQSLLTTLTNIMIRSTCLL